jgi:hypothetical protein
MLESAARMAGVDINLRDLDIEKDPAEFERMLRERMDATAAAFEERAATAKGRARKPTKAQLEKERKQREIQEAKQRDLKSLYKQLAKALHPDLEPDPVLKIHKESWMKRLTSAYAANDLRELLKIEMEWLGEEASNLATAGDDKLRIYCMVLKEQITEVRRNSDNLRHQPQYSPLWRFMDNFTGYIPDMRTVHVRLHDEILHQKNALEILKRGDKETRKMINEWADSHAQTFQQWDYPF